MNTIVYVAQCLNAKSSSLLTSLQVCRRLPLDSAAWIAVFCIAVAGLAIPNAVSRRTCPVMNPFVWWWWMHYCNLDRYLGTIHDY